MAITAGSRRFRLAIHEPERTDLPRHTYYVDTQTARRIKVYATVDGRGVSEVVREALIQWLEARDEKGIVLEER